MVATGAGGGIDAGAAPLALHGVVAGYGARAVLDRVTLTVTAGEIVGVIGPNGAGKSTLIRVITRVLPPRAGAVLLCGRDVATMRPAEVARYAAVVPQMASGPDGFTGAEFVLLGRTPHLRLLQSEGRYDHAVVRRAMALTGTLHLAGRSLARMSGGEMQRLLVARALAQEPRLLLLDEPTAHLDIAHQVAVFDLVAARTRADGLAVLAVVHDLTLAAQFCDRLLLLVSGRVMAEGPPADVLRPETLAAAYGGRVALLAHPETGGPVVVPLSGGGPPAGFAGE